MENTKQQLVDRIKSASNVLVTVSRNPSVDALSALLGLTLVLNKQGKHAAAVFSGQVPSTIEFLQPEQTIEKNTDSLRDFIIALDKNKADKLRYKVEDNVVRIYITPYKTSISQEDFEFSEGDFNIDVIIALGVRQQEDLDEAITAHGRILHDATVASINVMPDSGGLGSISWFEPQASSLSELVTELTQMLGQNLLDEQIATALLTGIVAETDRFSNDKTRSLTMSLSAALMQAGANQQLVASKLDGQPAVGTSDGKAVPEQSNERLLADNTASGDSSASDDDGTIQIDHNDSPADNTAPDNENSEQTDPAPTLPASSSVPAPDTPPPTPIDDVKQYGATETPPTSLTNNIPGPKFMTEPPTIGGTTTTSSAQTDVETVTDPLSAPASPSDPLLNHDVPSGGKGIDMLPVEQTLPSQSTGLPIQTQPPTTATLTPPPVTWSPPPPPSLPTTPPTTSLADNTVVPTQGTDKTEEETLAELEKAVGSSHLTSSTVDAARDEVQKAYSDPVAGGEEPLPPIDALNAQPLGGELHPSSSSPSTPQPPQVIDSTAPPPVPPPIPFQFGNSPPPA